MSSHAGASGPRGNRRARQLRPHVLPLEQRVVLSVAFNDIRGITFDTSGDVFVSYNSTTPFSAQQQQSVAEIDPGGYLVNSSVFGTGGSTALPGTLATVGSATLPTISDPSDILELQPNGQLFVFNPVSEAASQFDNLATYNPVASKVFNVQTGSYADLSSDINLADATFGDFGVYGSSLVVSAESNGWDFVMRVTYGASAPGTATVLVASPASDGLTASPGGVAVGPQGTVLATLPYQPGGAGAAAIHVPVGFNLFYDDGNSPQPFIPTLGLTTLPDIDSSGITVDSQNNFILAVTTSSLYGGGPGVAHINSALTAFLADPTQPVAAVPAGIAYQNVNGANYLALADPALATYTIAGELPLFSGQVSPAQLRQAYGVNQISFTGPGGTTVAGTGAGQTIAIVEEGVDPTLEADLHTFDQFFGIPDPPSFQVVDQNGVTTQNDTIVGEASLDVEWAHAIAPDASLVVYDAAYEPNNATASYENLIEAMHEASLLPGVSVVTLSYGEPESVLPGSGIDESQLDSDFTTPGVTFLAASGDNGAYGNGGSQLAVNYPAASPNVLAVGGTSIVIDSAGDYPGTGPTGEIGWGSGTNSGINVSTGGSGGGLSAVEPEPAWQARVIPTSIDNSGARAVPDVSLDSGIAQQYDVFASTLSASSDSAAAVGWLGDAGTSAASPIWAGLIAIANQGRVLEGGTPLTGYTQTIPALYSLPSADFHDILYGNNGYSAGPGYDLVTGLGTPVANLLVPDLASYATSVKILVTAAPTTATVGQAVTLTATVSNPDSDTGAPTGIVTVDDGSTPLGQANLNNGVATIAIFPPTAGTETITIAYGGDASDQPTAVTFDLPVNAAPAALVLSNLFATYNGAPHMAAVNTVPPGLPGVTVVYSQNGIQVANPTHAGTYTVTATLNNSNYVAPAVTGTLVIAQAVPTLTWAQPANITAGTPLSTSQLDATASLAGGSVAGLFTYSPAPGVVLPVGDDQSLNVSFQPIDTNDFKAVTASVPINVLPAPVMIVSEQPIFARKTNKRGKPVGPAVLTGFSFHFSEALNSSIAANPANYQVDTVAVKTVKKTRTRVLRPITSFTVSYSATGNEATIVFTGKQTFPTGGQINVLGGVAGAVNETLVGKTAFTIAIGGKRITPQ
jgi:hypothetical protein